MGFCASCQQLDISLAGFISHPGADDNPRSKSPIYHLGSLEDIRSKHQICYLCRLMLAAFQSGPLKRVTNTTRPSRLAIFGVWINALGSSKEQRLKSQALAILVWAESPQIPPGTYKIVIRAVSQMLPDQPHFGRLASTKSSFLNFSQITGWLKHCEKAHKQCHRIAESSKPTRNFFVIDVKAKAVVSAPEYCRYLALSYVWGENALQLQLTEDNFEVFTRKDSLQEQYLTPTIRDAIDLTRKLGERYLWVDALCILQDSDVIRQQTIQDMDRIYADALLTIIAGTCSSADDSIQGIRERRTWTQWSQKISPSLTLVAQFDFKDFLEDSTYSQRAWTFQEYQLSHRLLIFCENGQVYFSCKEGVCSEEVVLSKNFEPDAAMLDGAQLIKLDSHSDILWSTYSRAVGTFTGRKMKNEKDALNAFAGILRMICPERTLEGLPVPVFELALLWQPKQRIQRREGFCSWSWAGWTGQVHWFNDQCLENVEESSASEKRRVECWAKARTWIVWYSSWGANTRSPAYLLDGPPWLHGSAPSASIQQERFPKQSCCFMPTPSLLPRRLDRLGNQRRNIRYLQFWTASAYYRIELDQRAVIRYESLGPENTGNGLRLFLLCDDDNRKCGWVLLDEGWVEISAKQDTRLQEFILLSEGRCKRSHPNKGSKDQPPENDFLEFNAIMITWTGGIAERAGLGRIRKTALSRSCKRPMKWKEILLG